MECSWGTDRDRAVALRSRPFLLPSSQESFGLAALEAMACGVPVVASRVGGLPEVIRDGIDGFLLHPDDIEGMIEASALLLSDRTLHDELAEAASQSVRDRFCTERIIPLYEALYRSVSNR